MTRCSCCKRMVDQRRIELDASYRIVCPECYLANVPAEDIYSALLDLEYQFKREMV